MQCVSGMGRRRKKLGSEGRMDVGCRDRCSIYALIACVPAIGFLTRYPFDNNRVSWL